MTVLSPLPLARSELFLELKATDFTDKELLHKQFHSTGSFCLQNFWQHNLFSRPNLRHASDAEQGRFVFGQYPHFRHSAVNLLWQR